jgi:hypothetical protein
MTLSHNLAMCLYVRAPSDYFRRICDLPFYGLGSGMDLTESQKLIASMYTQTFLACSLFHGFYGF